jgi:hypothetical protein
MRWMGHVAYMRDMKNMYKILSQKPERNSPLERAKHRQENNTKMILKA